jgi:hypothetical protein
MVVALSCKSTRLNANHCVNNTGNEFCRERYGEEKPFCGRGTPDCFSDIEDGCLATMPDNPQCYSPCGMRQSADENDDCLGGTGTDTIADATGSETTTQPTDGSSTTGDTSGGSTTMGSTETGGCVGSDECTEPTAPICSDSGECVQCATNEECIAKDENTRACDDVSGQCFACFGDSGANGCATTEPVCVGNSDCVCTAHETCTDSACNFFDGDCLTGVTELHVDSDGGMDHDNIADAVATVGDSDVAIIYVHGGAAYDEHVEIAGGTIALLAYPGESPEWAQNSPSGGTSLTVTGAGTTVFVAGLTIRSNQDTSEPAISVADSAQLHLSKTIVRGNLGGGASAASGAQLRISNSFLGGDVNGVSAVSVDAASLDAVYTTLIGGFSSSYALSCTNVGAGDSVLIRNSILVTQEADDASIDCASADIQNSALEVAFANGTNNENVGNYQAGWFVNPNGPALDSDGADIFIGIAVTLQTDPSDDFEGDVRPPDADNFPGADVP